MRAATPVASWQGGVRLRLSLTTQQLAAIELMMAARSPAPTLAELVANAVRQEANAPLPARWRARRPPPGRASRRSTDAAVDVVLEPGAGCAVALSRGDVLRIEQTVGGQCVDLDAMTRGPAPLRFSAARTRTLDGAHPTRGASLWSSAPETALLSIVADSAPGHDLLFPACTAFEYAPLTGRGDHANCADVHARIRARAGLPADAAPRDPLNLWLPSEVMRSGRLRSWPAACRRGDHVEFVAHRDVVVVLNPCPDDLYGSSQYEPRTIRVIARAGARGAPQPPTVLARAPAARLGAHHHRSIVLPDRLREPLARVSDRGWLGDRDAEVARALLFRWWEHETISTRRPQA